MAKKSYRTQTEASQAVLLVAAYIRVSTEDQAESGLGMDAQRTRCKAMAQVKGWSEPSFYIDDGISGTKEVDKRPGLLKLMEDIRIGKINAVIIPSLDRLGRKVYIVINLVEEFRQYNVALVSCKESLDTSTPQGQFVLFMFAALAQLERDLIAQRTVDALDERGKRDGEKGGRMPYGYRRIFEIQGVKRVCIGIQVDQDAAKIVRRIFTLHKHGASLREIADKVSNGKQWRHSSIVEILRNRNIYKGCRRGESDVYWPVILK
jgi:site-specific DNA recombinase